MIYIQYIYIYITTLIRSSFSLPTCPLKGQYRETFLTLFTEANCCNIHASVYFEIGNVVKNTANESMLAKPQEHCKAWNVQMCIRDVGNYFTLSQICLNLFSTIGTSNNFTTNRIQLEKNISEIGNPQIPSDVQIFIRLPPGMY